MKALLMKIVCSFLTLSLCGASLSSRPKEFRKLVRSSSEFVPNENKIMSAGGEPTCEELRAMWRFSRRQSRAAEITNEIPTYRDPFAYNVWEQYPRVRSVLGNLRTTVRPWSRPVYGRIVQHAPNHHPRLLPPENRAYDEVLKYVDNGKADEEPRRRPPPPSTYRLSGGQPQPNRLSRPGSFQHLKELIWAERAKELQQQRMLEEAAAKSAAEKSIIYGESMKSGNSNYGYEVDPEAKAARWRLLNGEMDVDAAYAPELYRKPYRPRSVYSPESTRDFVW